VEYRFKCKNCNEEIVTRHLSLGEPAKCKKCGEFTKVYGEGIETVNNNYISEEMGNSEKRSKSGSFVNFMAYAGIFSVLFGLPILASFGEGIEDLYAKLVILGIIALIHLLGIILFTYLFSSQPSEKKSMVVKFGVSYYWLFLFILIGLYDNF